MIQLDQILWHRQSQKLYVQTLLTELIKYYAGRLVSLAIIGSYARGEARLNSDLDLYIVLQDQPAVSHSERTREFVKIEMGLMNLENQMWRDGVKMELSPIILTQAAAEHFNPLYLDMTDHAVMLFDRGGFLAEKINITRRQMKKWGSRRMVTAASWMWEIKPGLKSGEIIDYDK